MMFYVPHGVCVMYTFVIIFRVNVHIFYCVPTYYNCGRQCVYKYKTSTITPK